MNAIWAANVDQPIPSPARTAAGSARIPICRRRSSATWATRQAASPRTGTLLDKSTVAASASFYSAPPANYYARFWHEHGLSGKAYGFPYDDVGSYSTYISHDNPQYLLVAIGW